ncbi:MULTISPECIES: type II CAAX endopeptidase family protein [Cyanophyceae]|uniref:CPBP family intramembrane glutamic endopeptidase n=1 Tax=Cyanophyceae TaxID=3028117 RepID=UPI001684C2AA|nr:MULTISPECIES: type II CAAX endopeptidase family protein [Cyanophyceae]MBD1919491.1 CPBP family intramembrane metalloprotease [Phormidium sp. FACHB-77]MBD2054417.1 CPBP family intramembrane metalloprotease [Leptolyngbya sp. FACHB-60]
MSQVPFNHPQESRKPGAAASFRPNQVPRPGWPEIIVGLTVFGAVARGGVLLAGQLGLDPVVYGLALAALSVIAPFAGFGAAVLLRIRSLHAFSVRRVSRRWLLIGVGAGVVTFVVKGFAVMAYTALTGDSSTPQDVFGDGGSGGVLSLILSTLFIGLLVPLVEELLFRGVITNALLRYGPLIGVVGSTLIFALAHGINTVFPVALVFGLISAEMFRRSGSVWPGIIAHVINNLPTVFVLVLIRTA